MQTLSLTKRPGKIGPSINTRTQRHGEEEVPGVDIPVTGILVDADELAVLLQDTGAHAALFTGARSKMPEPRFNGIGPLAINDKFKNAKVVLYDVADDTIVFKPATVSKIRLEPQVGGLTEVSLTIQGVAPEALDVISLLNRKCAISILNGKLADRNENQAELPLEGALPTAVAVDLDAEDDDGGMSRTGRKIQAAARRRERKDIDG